MVNLSFLRETFLNRNIKIPIIISRRIVLGIQYDGAPWNGWQTQPHGLTVQNKLEDALRQFTLTNIVTTCAGRTDAGVHAFEQIVHFDTTLIRDHFSWVRGINSFLPTSIAVRWAHELPIISENINLNYKNMFHARFSAISRTYYYILYTHAIRSPLLVGKVGWMFRPLTIKLMQEGANYLIGEHDFTTFRATTCQASSPIRTIQSLEIQRKGNLNIFMLKANAFLQHMVRNIVASLVIVGRGTQQPIWIKNILDRKNRNYAAPTIAADGLYLTKVDYPINWMLPQEKIIWPWPCFY